MSKHQTKTWITEEEAAGLLELPTTFVRKLVTAGSLKGVIAYLSSRRYSYRYKTADLENYLFEDPFLAGLK